MLSRTLLILGASLAPAAVAAPAACVGGSAAGHPCQRVDLLARLDVATLGYGNLNDVWGWTDTVQGREYALVGATAGTVFVDITDPTAPRIVGRLPAHENIAPAKQVGDGEPGRHELCKPGSSAQPGPRPLHEEECGGDSTWRNVKVYADHAYVGSESGGHGLQVFDLTQLRAFPPGSAVQTFGETDHYGGFGNSHTLWIDAPNAMLYAVGSDTYAGGPHFVDLSDPADPVAAGGYAGDGYTHEILCQTYAGPDAAHVGREICIASNEDTVTVVDVTAKAAPVQLARVSYGGVGFTHQGYLTADQRYLFVNDELDEMDSHERTTTLVWDLVDLDAPVLVDRIRQPRLVIDHNLYLRDGYMFQSNYTAGLVVYDARDPLRAFELGYFDTQPGDDGTRFDGTWSNYPFFASGVVAVSDITRGLYLVEPQLGGAAEDARVLAHAGAGGTYEFEVIAPDGGYLSFSVGPDATLQGLELTPASTSLGTCATITRAMRCLIGPNPTGFRARMQISSSSGAPTSAVVMIAGPGDETAPDDNRVQVPHSPTSVVVTAGGGGGGGGVTAPALALALLILARARRRSLA